MRFTILWSLAVLSCASCVLHESQTTSTTSQDPQSVKTSTPDDVCQVIESLPRFVYPPIDAPCDAQVVFIDRSSPGGGMGTRESPASSLAHARNLTLENPNIYYWMIRGRGPYIGPLKAMDRVHVIGGFHGDWKHDPNMRTVIEGTTPNAGEPSFGGIFHDIQTPLTWSNLIIRAAPAGWGASSYGIWAWRSPRMTLRAVDVFSGLGGRGFPGDMGAPGLDGVPGLAGVPGFSDAPSGKSAWGKGSVGGLIKCSDTDNPFRGGQGGDGATLQDLPQYGRNAQHDFVTPPGVNGAHAQPHALNAQDGKPGASDPGVSISGFWQHGPNAYGQNGTHGLHGQSGHGGGGAITEVGRLHIAPGGASGGTGGCGGRGGQGGSPGGGSFGLFLVQSSEWSFSQRSSISSAVAGPGGDGGTGGQGGLGAPGGPSQTQWCHPFGTTPACDAAPFPAGAGGNGASGQDGGYGGGGAAGWSIALYCHNSTMPEGAIQLFAPAPQRGGFSAPEVERGQSGLSQNTYRCK